jgi:hypothetical protein
MPKRKHDTKRHLVASAKRLKVSLPMKMLRADMLTALQSRAMRIIVRAIRRHLLNKLQLVNSTDPISMEDIPPEYRWVVRERDRVYQFDATHMIEYLVSEGVFQNPFTRWNFRDEDLDRLDHICRRLHLVGTGSVRLVDRRNLIALERRQQRERLRTINFIDDECSQHLYAVVRLCARETTVPDTITVGMNVFFQSLAILEDADRDRAEQCLVYCIRLAATAFDRAVTYRCADMRHAIYCLLTQRLRTVYGAIVQLEYAAHMARYTRTYLFVGDPNVPNTPFPVFDIV